MAELDRLEHRRNNDLPHCRAYQEQYSRSFGKILRENSAVERPLDCRGYMCPHCRSNDVRLSQIRLKDILMLMLQAKPARCRACYSRFYLWPWQAMPATKRSYTYGPAANNDASVSGGNVIEDPVPAVLRTAAVGRR